MMLRAKANGGILVLDVDHARATGRRRYIGRRAVKSRDPADLPAGVPVHMAPAEFLERGDSPLPPGAWVDTGEVATLPCNNHWKKQIRTGALLPADEATARICDVPFSGGEE